MKLRSENPTVALVWSLWALIAACSDNTSSVETETHFLSACTSRCEDGLSCICGVCTQACSDDSACSELSSAASCAEAAVSCGGHTQGSACDIACSDRDGCSALGAAFTCVDGRCRAMSGGQSGAGGSSGGQSGEGGASAQGGASGQGGASAQGGAGAGAGAQGGTEDAAVDSGAGDRGVDEGCDAIGEPCCDPFPQDGRNYCSGVGLECGAGGACENICDCLLGAFTPVCGVDGMTYDATCGDECVMVEIACRGQCPCAEGTCAVACSGAAPEQEAIDACDAITEMAECVSYQTGSFPSSCRWITPPNSMCPPVP